MEWFARSASRFFWLRAAKPFDLSMGVLCLGGEELS